MYKVFIDGSAGTTGLRIYERLSLRRDIELITLSEADRKQTDKRREALNASDISFLCLPDAAAVEAEALVDNPDTAIIDTSTAHRVSDGWIYGFAELKGQREKIAGSKRIANPGCHASGFISLVAPLREYGLIGSDALLSCFSLTGYSGGGKKMIAEYSSERKETPLFSPRQYGLSQTHKHLPEMAKLCGLDAMPIFCPIVADYYSGMQVTVPLFREQVNGSIDMIKEAYRSYYDSPVVRFAESADEDGFLCSNKFSDYDGMEISVFGNGDRIILVSRFDNLGKGASGAAVQNMNILMGVDERTGLNLL